MNPAVVRIKMLTLALGALNLAVNISLFCFVQYNILKLHMYKPEPAVRLAHYVAEVAAILNCLMCFFDCYVVCFERSHSRRHVKALVYAMLLTVIFVSNSGSYFYITNGHYQYTIPTKKITAFYPAHLQTLWYDEIHNYLVEYEDTRNATETRLKAGKYLKTLNHFQKLSHCCGVTSYADYTSLGLPIPPTCECPKHSLLSVVRCTIGRKITAGVARAIDSEAENQNGSVRAASHKYELKSSMKSDGTSAVALRKVTVPLLWLYEK